MTRFSQIVATLLIVLSTSLLSAQVSPVHAGPMQTYIVLYDDLAVPASASTTIAGAGGSLIYKYDTIGVVIASSDNPYFRDSLMARDTSIQGAAATNGFGIRLIDDMDTIDIAAPLSVPSSGDHLSGLQWDMDQIQAPAARSIISGSPSVVVGDIDTGLDWTHPDLAPNVDFTSSVSCIGGVPNPDPSAWLDDNGHGTHTAGTIAAAKNDIGIVGVAPNVKIAGIKAGDADGFFFPEAVVCAFMWAATHHVKVTNNSYFADPWYLNCVNDPVQRAIWNAERRAIKFAIQSGVTVVAAMGNFADDLAHPTQDIISPDNTTPVTRTVHNDCADIPVEITGVIGVTANGNLRLKSFYSSYGVGVTQVIAPGGDSILQRTLAASNGRVLSTWPSYIGGSRRIFDCSVSPCAVYRYLQGTSMASPHVAGVAALIASLGVTSPGSVAARITQTADPTACPDTSIYAPFPSVNNGAPQVCQGGTGYNSFNGYGQVDALSAVTAKP